MDYCGHLLSGANERGSGADSRMTKQVIYLMIDDLIKWLTAILCMFFHVFDHLLQYYLFIYTYCSLVIQQYSQCDLHK